MSWTGRLFIGRALAQICIRLADKQEATALERADFLMRLGLPRREAALVIGSTDESSRVMALQRDRKKGDKKA